MAEFQEVMRQFDRMCDAHAGCIDCPLNIPDGVSDDKCSIYAFVDNPEHIEREVMSWAAEHPEPVYPAWEMYLAERMIADMRDGKTHNPQSVEEYMRRTSIPADIAEKLGIESKEGT